MIITLSQTFHANWTLHKHTELATYDVEISIEGPERALMTDVSPICKEIKALENEDLSKRIGRSSLEAVALYIRDIANRYLDSRDHLKTIKLKENGFFTVTLDDDIEYKKKEFL